MNDAAAPTDPSPTPPPASPAPPGPARVLDERLLVAAAASLGAGLVHAAAAGTHNGDSTVAALFALAAVAQVGWAAAVFVGGGRRLSMIGALINGSAVAAWVASRTVGLPLVDGLREVEEVGTQDLLAAILGATALVAAALSLVRWNQRWSFAVVASVVALALPGMVAEHDHGDHSEVAVGGEHAHGEDSTHAHEAEAGTLDAEADGEEVAHEHGDDSAEHDEAHEEGAGDAAAGEGDAHGHDHAIPERLDHEPTDEQLEDARELITETREATTRYADPAVAVAEGFVSIGDSRTGYEHYVHADWLANDNILDPNEPESLVYRVTDDGGREFVTVMYLLPPDSTMDDVPDIAGNLTAWHDHGDLCFNDGSVAIAGFVVDGECVPGGEPGTPPMLHVWVVDNECGPFAGVDHEQMTGSCVNDFEL